MKIMRLCGVLCVLLVGCGSADSAAERGFHDSLIQSMQPLCGADTACQKALVEQTMSCMNANNWRQFFDNKDQQEEVKRFTRAFLACVVDEHGEPYFESTL